MTLLWKLVFLASFCLLFNNLCEAHSHHKKLPSAVIVGTVYCDTCFHQDFSKSSHFIPGATVAVECKDSSSNSRTSFSETVKTNEHGEFKVNLPLSVSKHIKKIKNCSVKLISSSEPYCGVASSATSSSSSIHLKSRKEGTHIFSAGFFTFKPLKQPQLCDQKPRNFFKNSKKLGKSSISDPNDPSFYPPITDPPSSELLPPIGNLLPPVIPQIPINMPNLPPVLPEVVPKIPPKSKNSRKTYELSNLPPLGQNLPPVIPQIPNMPNLPPVIPQIPNMPNLPNLPPLIPGVPNIPPLPKKETSKETRKTYELSNSNKVAQTSRPDQFFPFPPFLPPNPLLPPPSIFPPVFPSPPPSILPPVLPSPPSTPPSIFPPLPFPPLVPGLTPSPPPPRSTPLPFPFPPIPGFPGVPPSVTSKKSNP